MVMIHGKKGLQSILTLMVVLFVFSTSAIIALTAWNKINDDGFQLLPNETVSDDVKAKIDGLTGYMQIGDRIFLFMFVMLLISYLISTITLPVDRPVFFFVFLGSLIFVTLFAMVLSNSWRYLISNQNFIDAAGDFSFTTFFMTWYPIMMFLVALLGAVIFYTRKSSAVAAEEAGIE